tara:strand:+ start:746 stop:934 length:189 start_codon:yes stop_codon:yes gene_type:complete
MAEEFEYVMVESGQAPTLENNLLPTAIHLSEGEAEHTNEQLACFDGCNQIYMKLEKQSVENE